MENEEIYRNNKKWKILKNVMPKNTILDNCASSITGICNDYPTVQECVNECEKSDKCDYGYYIQSKNGNLCLPMNSELHYDYYNPTFNWIKSSDNNPTYAFINTDKIPFPDVDSNSAFFNDVVYLQGEMGYIYTPRDKIIGNLSDIPIVGVSKEKKTELKISLKNPYNPDFISNASLREGIPFVFTINNTGYILRKSKDNNDMEWVFRGGIEISDADTLSIILLLSENSNDVYYGQKFLIKYLDGFLTMKNDKLVYSPGTATLEKTQHFTMESNHSIYSCINGKCQQVEKIDRKILAPKFNGLDTYRSDTCFNACNIQNDTKNNENITKKGKTNILARFTMIVFCIYILYIIFIGIFCNRHDKNSYPHLHKIYILLTIIFIICLYALLIFSGKSKKI
jgi:preprotein translocase subunit SecG